MQSETKNKYFKNMKSRVSYFSVKLPEEKITDLKIRGKTTIIIGLRYNWPMLSGLRFDEDSMATIVGKRASKGFYEYDLVSE